MIKKFLMYLSSSTSAASACIDTSESISVPSSVSELLVAPLSSDYFVSSGSIIVISSSLLSMVIDSCCCGPSLIGLDCRTLLTG